MLEAMRVEAGLVTHSRQVWDIGPTLKVALVSSIPLKTVKILTVFYSVLCVKMSSILQHNPYFTVSKSKEPGFPRLGISEMLYLFIWHMPFSHFLGDKNTMAGFLVL